MQLDIDGRYYYDLEIRTLFGCGAEELFELDFVILDERVRLVDAKQESVILIFIRVLCSLLEVKFEIEEIYQGLLIVFLAS